MRLTITTPESVVHTIDYDPSKGNIDFKIVPIVSNNRIEQLKTAIEKRDRTILRELLNANNFWGGELWFKAAIVCIEDGWDDCFKDLINIYGIYGLAENLLECCISNERIVMLAFLYQYLNKLSFWTKEDFCDSNNVRLVAKILTLIDCNLLDNANYEGKYQCGLNTLTNRKLTKYITFIFTYLVKKSGK